MVCVENANITHDFKSPRLVLPASTKKNLRLILDDEILQPAAHEDRGIRIRLARTIGINKRDCGEEGLSGLKVGFVLHKMRAHETPSMEKDGT